MLWLALFNDAEHYQSIRRRGDRERGAAHIEDKLALPHERDRSEAARIARGELAPQPASSAAMRQVIMSLPTGHGFSQDHISGILARHKGNIHDAVETLIDELNDDGASDERVDLMLDCHAPSRIRDIHRQRGSTPGPDSPTGSSSTSQESISSASSKATTPSTQSSRRSHKSGSKDRGKPYDRPNDAGRKVKELSKELEELQVGRQQA